MRYQPSTYSRVDAAQRGLFRLKPEGSLHWSPLKLVSGKCSFDDDNHILIIIGSLHWSPLKLVSEANAHSMMINMEVGRSPCASVFHLGQDLCKHLYRITAYNGLDRLEQSERLRCTLKIAMMSRCTYSAEL